AAAGWMAEPLPPEGRPSLDTVATLAGPRPPLPSWLAGGLAQATRIVPLPSRTAGQPRAHATVAPTAAEPLSAEGPPASTADRRLIKAGASNHKHWAVDQVISDPALELTDGDLLHRPVASV